VGFIVGVAFGTAGLHARMAPADSKAIFAAVGAVGAEIVLIWVALQKGAVAGRGDVRLGIGDSVITRRKSVIFICVAIAAYIASILFLAFYATPQLLRQAVNVNWWIGSLGLVISIIGAPLAEELFFRGWFWTGLRTSWGTLPTAAITSVMWLALHLPDGIGRVTLLLPLALALSLSRHLCGSVRAPIIVHACYNGMSVASPWIFLWFGWLAWP
jgi:membrane protease YdiL (CAAX protease family)